MVCVSDSGMIQAATQRAQVPEEGDYAVVARAAELCNPFLDGLGEVTLSIRGPVASSVLRWNAAIFRPLLHPGLLEVLDRASEGGSFEISTLDCRLDASLPLALRMQSRDAGKRLIQGLLAPRGDRSSRHHPCPASRRLSSPPAGLDFILYAAGGCGSRAGWP